MRGNLTLPRAALWTGTAVAAALLLYNRRRIIRALRRPASPEWWRLSAVEVVAALKEKRVTPSELIEVAAARISAVDGAVNAVPTRCFDRARACARQFEAGGGAPGLLYGLPVLLKDNQQVEGVLCTAGTRPASRRSPTPCGAP